MEEIRLGLAQTKRLKLTGNKHILGERLAIERIGGSIEQMALNDSSVHDLATGQYHGIVHDRVHQRITIMIGSIVEINLQLLFAQKKKLNLGGDFLESIDLVRKQYVHLLQSIGKKFFTVGTLIVCYGLENGLVI